MTNAEIIRGAQLQLVRAGVIKPDEEIHTFNAWKKLGYFVLRGERPCVL